MRQKKSKEGTSLITEAKAVSVIASHFEWFRNLCFPNVYYGGGEMDLCIVTPAHYMWEIEVKLSLSDWKADEHKQKWGTKDREYVSRFYYAVPTNLIDKVPEFVPADMGIIEIYNNKYHGWSVKIARPCTYKRGKKITDRIKENLMRRIYFRYWSKRVREKSE